MRVALLAGGRSEESPVSLSSAAVVGQGLADAGHEVVSVFIDCAGAWFERGRRLALQPPDGLLDCDVVFPVVHGRFGEDGALQGLLELLDIPYVGAGVRASAVCMDKIAFKDHLRGIGMPQVRYVAVPETRWRDAPGAVRGDVAELGLPLFVKPARLGSSVAIVKVKAAERLDTALEAAFSRDSLAIVEQFSAGTEVQCSVIGLERPEVSIVGEIVLRGGGWYDYQAKYVRGWSDLIMPARIPDAAAADVRRLAVDTFLKLGCAGLARVGFFVEPDRVLINEADTLPRFTPTSTFPRLWAAGGMPLPELCNRLLGYALERFRAERQADPGSPNTARPPDS